MPELTPPNRKNRKGGAGNEALAMRPWSARGLLIQILVIMVVPLAVLTLVIIFGSLTLHQQAMRTMVGERDERAAELAANTMSSQIETRRVLMQELARRVLTASPGMLADSSYLLPYFDAGLALVDGNGGLVEAAGDPAAWEALTGAADPAFVELLEASRNSPMQAVLSDNFSHPVTGAPLVLVAALAPGSDQVAAGAFTPTALAYETLKQVIPSHHPLNVLVVDKNRRVLAQLGQSDGNEDVQHHPGVAEALAGQSGITYAQAADGEHVVTYSAIDPPGWALVMEEPWEMVTTPLLDTTLLAPLVLVPVMLLALLSLWFGARQVVRPLQALAEQALDLSWGKFEAIEKPVGGITEIRQLQTELVHLAHKVQASRNSLRGYIGAITTGQEDERLRLARELHDDTIQTLIALKQRVQLARMKGKEESTMQPLIEIEEMTEDAIQNVRRQVRALRPIYLEDLGLAAALEMLARETSQADLEVSFKLEGAEQRLDPAVELALYRMAQEGLSNVVRHARASRAEVKLTCNPETVTLEIEDAGQGFEIPTSPAEFAPSGHYGLLGMYERAELIGGTIEMRSAPGQGTFLKVSLPVKRAG